MDAYVAPEELPGSFSDPGSCISPKTYNKVSVYDPEKLL